MLGIFGREGLDMAIRWVVPPTGSPVYNAFKMYRNYDGLKSTFGDVSVSTTSNANPDHLSAFAARRVGRRPHGHARPEDRLQHERHRHPFELHRDRAGATL